MILKKEIIEKAVNWWVEKVTANQPHSNGDNGYTSIVTCLLADSRTKKISKKQTDVFKKALARCSLGCSVLLPRSFLPSARLLR